MCDVCVVRLGWGCKVAARLPAIVMEFTSIVDGVCGF